MSTIVIGPLFAFPLHPASGPVIEKHYLVTNSFNGPDLVNGGIHRATDVGNFGMNDPILAPLNCRARGRRHFDSTLGIEYELGGDWTLELWHLNGTLPVPVEAGVATVGEWVDFSAGQQTGITGNTGPPLQDGSPMPAHTHIVLKFKGVALDAEPYLFGMPIPTEEDDMKLPPSREHLMQGIVQGGVNVRRAPVLTAEVMRLIEGDTHVPILFPVPAQGEYVIDGVAGRDWIAVALGDEIGYVARPLIREIFLTAAGQGLLPAKARRRGGPSPDELAQITKAAMDAGFVAGRDAALQAAATVTPPE